MTVTPEQLAKRIALMLDYIERLADDHTPDGYPAVQRKTLDECSSIISQQAPQVEQLMREVERTSNNRDMWKAQCERQAAELAALREQGQWRPVAEVPDGDVWFALDCGHVVAGYKSGSLLDWSQDSDSACAECCFDAAAVAARPYIAPAHPSPTSAEGA